MGFNGKALFVEFLILFVFAASALAGDMLFYKELNLLGGYSTADGWVGESETLSNSIGFEHYAKFSSDYGDYLTTDIQIRGAYDANVRFSQSMSCEIHNAWAEYRANNALKIKAGHFEPAFGLEPIVDTHGTILQTLAMMDIGYKKDWGVELRGSLSGFDYLAALQMGSGMSIRRIDSSYLATLRVGNPAGSDFQYGVSFLCGNVLETMGMSTFPKNHLLSNKAVLKERVGFDLLYYWNSFLLKAEGAYGINDNDNVIGYLFEADYTAPASQNWELALQFKSFINDMKKPHADDSTVSASLTYKLSQASKVCGAFIYDLNTYKGQRDTRFLLQFYYYGK